MVDKNTAILAASDVYKTYGKKDNAYTALRGIDLAVRGGESVAIVGKSGSGKSTLMHILAGLDRPTSGAVAWSGERLNKMREKKLAALRGKKVGFIFQQFFLQPTMTVLENTILPLKIAGVSPRPRKKRALDALKAVGLAEKTNNIATELSGGQKQRVAIARALVMEPEIIFADEPTGNLDSETGAQVMKLLFELQKSHGITLVIVTHDEDLAKRCDRIIHMQDGRIVK